MKSIAPGVKAIAPGVKALDKYTDKKNVYFNALHLRDKVASGRDLKYKPFTLEELKTIYSSNPSLQTEFKILFDYQKANNPQFKNHFDKSSDNEFIPDISFFDNLVIQPEEEKMYIVEKAIDVQNPLFMMANTLLKGGLSNLTKQFGHQFIVYFDKNGREHQMHGFAVDKRTQEIKEVGVRGDLLKAFNIDSTSEHFEKSSVIVNYSRLIKKGQDAAEAYDIAKQTIELINRKLYKYDPLGADKPNSNSVAAEICKSVDVAPLSLDLQLPGQHYNLDLGPYLREDVVRDMLPYHQTGEDVSVTTGSSQALTYDVFDDSGWWGN